MTVAEIMAILDDFGFDDVLDARQVQVINDVVSDVISREAWPFLEAAINLTFNAASATASNLPADFTATLTLTNTTTGAVLQPERLDVVEKNYSRSITEQGEPRLYYFIGEQLNVWPVPAASTTLRMKYIRAQTALTAASTEAAILIPARHHQIISWGSLENLALQEDDYEAAQVFNGKFEQRLQNMRQDVWVKQWDRPDRIYLTDEEGEDYYDGGY